MGFSSLGQTLTAKDIFDLVKEDLQQVERELSAEPVAGVDTAAHIAEYLHAPGGRRMRPALLLLAARMQGLVTQEAIRMAAVVEMIHAATLVHDDIVDVSGEHAIRGNHMSVLAGDWLYMQAFQNALRERNFHILDLLIHLTQTMVEGELLQVERLGQIGITEAGYLQVVDRKTGSLFAVCAKLGSHLAGAGTAVESKLGEFAWNLGMAFHLSDESSLQEGKLTLPLLYALETASGGERRLVETVLRDRNFNTVPLSRILKMIERHRGAERARERVQDFTQRAKALISEFPDSPYQRALAAMPDLVADRDQ